MSLYQWSFSSHPAMTLVELSMIKFSGAIREKDRWWDKVEDKQIRRQWKAEAKNQGMPAVAISYVFKELRNYYSILQEGKIGAAAVDGTYKADDFIPTDLKQQFLAQVAELEADPSSEKMWHPDSGEQVLDLVHPSMHCFVADTSRAYTSRDVDYMSWLDFCYGRTAQVLSSTDYTKKWNIDPKDHNSSIKYQWLPAEFDIDLEGNVSINSYINNLHPIKYKALYKSISQIFAQFIPLFNVLTDLQNPDSRLRMNRIKGEIVYSNGSSHPPPLSVYDNYEDDDAYLRRYRNHLPRPTEVPQWEDLEFPHEYELKGRTVQVIVKLANIILTPERPTYSGGSWHVEGMKNERIVATGIYYYDSENISESSLSFRRAIETPSYEQDDRKGVRAIYGLAGDGKLNQVVGSVLTPKDRCLAFPNTYQHQVQSFKLLDKTKPGYRKILVFFLVDPAVSILSTAHVPPQQTEWYWSMLYSIRRGTYLELLPDEIFVHILKYVGGPMSREEMRLHMTELMKERSKFVKHNSSVVFERTYTLCEH